MYSNMTEQDINCYTFKIYERDLCKTRQFLCPPDRMIGAYCFCPVCLSVCSSVCLFVVNFNLRYNFWTVRDRDFIFRYPKCAYGPYNKFDQI